jgi:gluconokinase
MGDVLGREIVASEEPEASARGAALLALEAAGLLKDLADAPARTGRVYRPDAGRRDRYAAARARQQQLYGALIGREWWME